MESQKGLPRLFFAMRDNKGRFVKGHKQINTGVTHFVKGFIPWNKDKKTGIVTRGCFKKGDKRIIGNKFGFGKIPWNKGKKVDSISGENHYLWKGTTPLNKWIRNRLEYQVWRKSIFERNDYTCQICGKRGGKLVVDHWPKSLAQLIDENNIKTIDEALCCNALWDIDKNRTLCNPCHLLTDNFGKKNSFIGKEVSKWQKPFWTFVQ